jgi:hypothetical protein
MEADFLRPSALAQPAQAYILARDHAIEQMRPLLSRRRSPKRPSDGGPTNMATPRINPKCPTQNHAASPTRQPLLTPESIRRTNPPEFCACRRRRYGARSRAAPTGELHDHRGHDPRPRLPHSKGWRGGRQAPSDAGRLRP